MQTTEFLFSNSGDKEYNDVVFPDGPFDLAENSYVISIHPDPKTTFWRWGIALSREPQFSFSPEHGRYNNEELRFLEVNVGAKNGDAYSLPDRIEIGSYYIYPGDKSILARHDQYTPGSEAQVVIRKVEDVLFFTLTTHTFKKTASVRLEGYHYFQVFAWADYKPFQLRMKMDILSKLEFNVWEPAPLNQENFMVLVLPPGMKALLDKNPSITHLGVLLRQLLKADSSLHEQLLQLKPGCLIVIFEAAIQAGFCVIKVEPAEQEGREFAFTIAFTFHPYIPITHLDSINISSNQWESNDSALIALSRSQFTKLLSTACRFPHATLNEEAVTYLMTVYKAFREGKMVDDIYTLPQMWKEGSTFDPYTIDPLFITGASQITIYGVSLVHQRSDLIENMDRVLFAIKAHLQTAKNIHEVDTSIIRSYCPDITPHDIELIFRLMGHFPNLYKDIAMREDKNHVLMLNNKPVYENYRSYNGLADFTRKHLLSVGRAPISYLDELSIHEVGEQGETVLTTTSFRRKSRDDFNPVMGVQELAADMANIILTLPQEKGKMIGVFGKWGRGKSFFIEQLSKELKGVENKKFHPVTYYAWKYQETPAAWAYLYEVMADAYLGEKKGWKNYLNYYRKLFLLNWKRKGIKPIVKDGLAILGTGALWQFLWATYPNLFYWLAPFTGLGLMALLRFLHKQYSTKAIDLIRIYSTRHSYKSTLGMQSELQEELVTLVKTWIPLKNNKKTQKEQLIEEKIFLVVEDLDRCGEDKQIPIIDALRVLLDDKAISERMIVLVALDDRLVKNAVAAKYKSFEFDLPSDKEDKTRLSKLQFIAEYLDKHFISAIKLGSLSETQRKDFIDELLSIYSKKDKPNSIGNTQQIQPIESLSNADTSITAAAKPNTADTTTQAHNPPLADKHESDGTPPTTSGNLWEELNATEVEAIRSTISNWSHATPRNMYIFHYRYLLTKNMLINHYQKNGLFNPWESRQNILDLVRILLHFSSQYDPSVISDLKQKVQENQNPIYSLKELSIAKHKQDWVLLLEILEIVIAY